MEICTFWSLVITSPNGKKAFPIRDHTALTVADKLVINFICHYGCPDQIHTDQGREFESHLFKQVCTLLGIEKN